VAGFYDVQKLFEVRTGANQGLCRSPSADLLLVWKLLTAVLHHQDELVNTNASINCNIKSFSALLVMIFWRRHHFRPPNTVDLGPLQMTESRVSQWSNSWFRILTAFGAAPTLAAALVRVHLSVMKPYPQEEGHIRCLSIQGSGTAIRRAIQVIRRPSSLCTAFLARVPRVRLLQRSRTMTLQSSCNRFGRSHGWP
jgi:hypothetical protein